MEYDPRLASGAASRSRPNQLDRFREADVADRANNRKDRLPWQAVRSINRYPHIAPERTIDAPRVRTLATVLTTSVEPICSEGAP